MSATKETQLTTRIEEATRRLATLKARELLRTLRAQQRQAALARKDEGKHRVQFGSAVLDAGFGHWHPLEVLGVLLDAQARLSGTPEEKLAARLRAGEFLAKRGRLELAPRPPETGPGEAGDSSKEGAPTRVPAWAAKTSGEPGGA